ncbi:Lsr2 family protein, partial [Patescibacteria group bacterium]|nr:Lsr2 family protein [Patescibacteria group bacterium]
MRKKFMEGFKKFTAMFVLIQMVMVLFPAPIVSAAQPVVVNNPNNVINLLNFYNHETGSTTPLSTEATNVINAEHYSLGYNIIADVGNAVGTVEFSVDGLVYEIDTSEPLSIFGDNNIKNIRDQQIFGNWFCGYE